MDNDDGVAGIDSNGNQEAVLMFVQKKNRVALQTLIRHFVTSPETGQMSVSTLKSHLSKLVKRGELGKLKDGKKSVYCVPGESLPEKMPISEADYFLLDECKKIVSEMIASGLIWPDTWGEENPNDKKLKYPDRLGEGYHLERAPAEWIDRRIEKRFELSQKAYSLWYAIDQHQDHRDYKIPLPYRWLKPTNWEEEKYDVMGEWVGSSVCLDSDSLYSWINYFVRVIDFLSRELAKAEGMRKPPKAKGKKAAPRP